MFDVVQSLCSPSILRLVLGKREGLVGVAAGTGRSKRGETLCH
jgi:hypothetical protein